MSNIKNRFLPLWRSGPPNKNNGPKFLSKEVNGNLEREEGLKRGIKEGTLKGSLKRKETKEGINL